MTGDNVELLRGGYDALGRRDLTAVLDLFHDDIEWIEPEAPGYPLGGVHRGLAGVEELLNRVPEHWERFRCRPEWFIDAGDRAVVTGSVEARAHGREIDVEVPFAHVLEIRDGMIVRGQSYMDLTRLASESAAGELALLADELLSQAAAIREEWERLGVAVDGTTEDDPDAGADLDDGEADPDSGLDEDDLPTDGDAVPVIEGAGTGGAAAGTTTAGPGWTKRLLGRRRPA